jgi:hypothetical protein
MITPHKDNITIYLLMQLFIKTYSGKAVSGLELLGIIDGIIYQAEPSGVATTIGGAESKDENCVNRCDLVHLSELLS